MEWKVTYTTNRFRYTNDPIYRMKCTVSASTELEACKSFYNMYSEKHFTLSSLITMPYYGEEVIGYTMSDGYALCCKHARYGQLRDSGNETGFCYPIFNTDESFDCSCDVCNEVISEEYREPATEETDESDGLETDEQNTVAGSIAEIVETVIDGSIAPYIQQLKREQDSVLAPSTNETELTAILDNNNVPYNRLRDQQVSFYGAYITRNVFSIVADSGLIEKDGLFYAVELVENLWIVRTKQGE